MAPLRSAVLLALGCLVCLMGSSMSFQCQAPVWPDNAGTNPFIARRGKVVLVALLKGYCGYCVHQAGKMYQLKNQLINEGFPDVDMLIINGGETRSRSQVNNLINASPLEVIQDTPEHDLYQRVFRGFKDDFLVYDRCNQAAIYIPHPYSDLDRGIVKNVVKAVHMGRHDCYCSLDYTPARSPSSNQDADAVMQGDDPNAGTRFYRTHDMTNHMLPCNPTDALCLQFQRAIAMQHARRGIGPRHGGLRRRLREMRRTAGIDGGRLGRLPRRPNSRSGSRRQSQRINGYGSTT